MNQKPITIFMILVILVLGLALGYMIITKDAVQAPVPTATTAPVTTPATPANDVTADWKTYKNEKYGFEIKYPKNWNYDEYDPKNESSNGDLLWVNFSAKDSTAKTNYILSVEVKNKTEQIADYDKTEVVFVGSEKSSTSAYLFYDKKLDECYGVSNIRGGCGGYSSVVLSKNGYGLTISGKLENNSVSEAYKKIISTFKFTSSTEAAMSSQIAEAVARDLFSKKYKDRKIQSVLISKFTENHMRGEVTFAPSKEDLENSRGGEGGIFLAAKVNENWKLVYDGNGQIECKTVKPYGFPSNMINDCL